MRRREVLTVFGGMAALPGVTRAQQAAVPIVGYMSSSSAETSGTFVDLLRDGLKQSGYIEGRNIAMEVRWAEGRYDLLPAFARELVARKVSVIVAIGGPAARAAKQATSAIPIVFQVGGDPVRFGLVDSLARPGGNATGIALNVVELTPKRLELLRELIPNLKSIAFLSNPEVEGVPSELADVQKAAGSMGLDLQLEEANRAEEIEPALARAAKRQPSGLLVGSSPLFVVRRAEIVRLAARLAIPAIYELSLYVTAGGLLSYGPAISSTIRPLGIYTGKILGGIRPQDLPVQQPTKFELVINLETARALGLVVPSALLTRADEVIE